jgi:hypothetical protein
MILRRLALFLALLFGVGATQVPEYVEQYRQRLGGAIDELAAMIARFDSDSAQQGLTEDGGIARLRDNADRFVQQRGEQMRDEIARLAMLREAQADFRAQAPVARLVTFATHFDQRVARGAWSDFEPAVPTSGEAFVLGLIGFLIGGGSVHVASRPFRRRGKRPMREASQLS